MNTERSHSCRIDYVNISSALQKHWRKLKSVLWRHQPKGFNVWEKVSGSLMKFTGLANPEINIRLLFEKLKRIRTHLKDTSAAKIFSTAKPFSTAKLFSVAKPFSVATGQNFQRKYVFQSRVGIFSLMSRKYTKSSPEWLNVYWLKNY